MLHILNGDATAAVFAASGLAGDVLVWRDILMEGPAVPDGSTRAAFLARYLAIDADQYQRGWQAQARGLAATGRHDEVVLWFEHDLFCTVNLWYLLAWFAEHPGPRLSLVYPGSVAGIQDFRGLGALEGRHLPALFDQRVTISAPVTALGRAAWAAYASPDPRAMERLGAEASALPFVGESARLHLGRFPSPATGLSEAETAIVQALREPRDFAELFRAVSAAPPVRHYGAGDIQVAAYCRELSTGTGPLLTIAGGDEPHTWRLAPTARAGAVLARRARWTDFDRWLGGVRVDPTTPWRWDPEAGRLASA